MKIKKLRIERLDDVQRITWAVGGRVFTSEEDAAHTVRVYDESGKWLTQMSNAPDHAWAGELLIAGVATGGN